MHLNGMMLQSFEWDLPADGSLWRSLRQQAARLAFLGISSVWLPPACKGSGGANDVGYGSYDLYDLGEFDQKGSVRTKYGTAQEYQEAVKTLRQAGIQTLADAVLNHRLGADGTEEVPVRWVDVDDRNRKAAEEEPGRVFTRFDFPGRGERYSAFRWDHRCFTGVDHNALDPGHRLFLLQGKEWAQDVDGEKGNYDYLMGADVDVNNPEVRDELIRWGKWYLKKTGVDGFRLDAVKHISAAFYRQWLAELRRASGREVYAVGEYWNSDVRTLHRYLDQVDRAMDLFDVPLHFHLYQASRSGGSYDMRGMLTDTLVSTRAQQAVTFVDNHDTQPGQSLESWVDGWFKAAAYGLILLRKEGYPCVFWGDLRGIPAKGIGAVPQLPLLMRLRLYWAHGEERDWFDHEDVVGFTRAGSDDVPDSGLAFLCTNAHGGSKRMEMGKQWAGRRFRCVIGGQRSVRVDSDGWAEFSVSDGGCSVYIPSPSAKGVAWRAMQDGLRWLRQWVRHFLPW